MKAKEEYSEITDQLHDEFVPDNPLAEVECPNDLHQKEGFAANLKYLFAGILFSTILVKAEVVSWFRIQEMFRLQSFHMYGIIGSAILIGAISVFLIKRYKIKSIHGEEIEFHSKKFSKGHIYGGLIFGLGWALTGACPGPLFAQIGSGFLAAMVTLASAVAGTWVYGYFREKLPH